jgi:dihydrofolate reductase
MTIRSSVFIAASLDGYIARAGGDISWLNEGTAADPGEDFGFKTFFNSVDTLVMGRKTYEAALSFADWPYRGKRVVVLNHRGLQILARLTGQIESMSGTPSEVSQKLERSGAVHLYIDGGKTIQGFLAADLIDEITLTILPILLGAGIPLFGTLSTELKLELLTSRSFSNGFVQNRYRIIHTA